MGETIIPMNEKALLVLAFIKHEPHRVSISKMIQELEISREEVLQSVEKLHKLEYIQQDGREQLTGVEWNHIDTTYYTVIDRRSEIVALLKYVPETKQVTISNNYVWYASYGSNMLYERFLHYIQGGTCRFNNKYYRGCTDKSLPKAALPVTINYELYIGHISISWGGSGVAFLDKDKRSKTLGRMYLITKEQFEDIRDQEVRSNWYDEELCLNEYLGIEVKTITSSQRKPVHIPSKQYKKVIEQGLKETYGESLKDVNQYLAKIMPYMSVASSDTLETIEIQLQEEVSRSQKLTKEERERRLQQAPVIPTSSTVTTTVYIRNPDVVAARLDKANGICEKCNQPAPFLKATDGKPYLEVHHVQMLSDGGEDTVANTRALCPNCHKEVHFGNGEIVVN